ncbi:MAG TPA: hypothetical protein VK459_21835, partial [Polyangiaceae bacterium]|nr:hypothetical protein [Polyangiaceae bacterium]
MVPRAALAAALVTGALLTSCKGKDAPSAKPGVEPAAPTAQATQAAPTASQAPGPPVTSSAAAASASAGPPEVPDAGADS